MKLHLPLSLRLSLALSVAALAAAPSHAAITIWDVSTWEGASADGSFTVGNTGSGDPTLKYVALDPRQSWDTEWSVMFSAKGSDLTGNLSLIGLALSSTATIGNNSGIVEGATMSDGNLTLTTWANASSGQSSGIDFSTRDNVTFVMSRTSGGTLSLSAYDSSDFTQSLFPSSSQNGQSFDGYYLSGFVFGGIGTDQTPEIPKKFTNNANNVSFEANSDVGSYGLTKVGFLSGSVATVDDLQNFYNAGNLTWNGSAEGNWSDASWSGTAGDTTISAFDSATFATEGARVTVDTPASADAISVNENTTFVLANNLSANSVTVAGDKTLALEGAGTMVTSSLRGGTVNVEGSTVTVNGAISNATLGVTNGGTVTANSLVGVTATVEAATDTTQGSTLKLAGTELGAVGRDTTVNGALTLTGGGRVIVAGNVTLGSVVNNLTAGDDWAFVGVASNQGTVTLKFTEGVTDLTSNSSNTHSRIGFDSNGTIIVGAEASVKTSLVYNSSTVASNAAVEVQKGGTLEMTASGTNNMSSLDNRGEVTAAGHLKIGNGSHLGGTVEVGETLTFSSGTTVISGDVSANKVAGGAAILQGSDDGQGRLTIKGVNASGFENGSSLVGNFTIVKEGSGYTQNFANSGDNSRFTGSLEVKGGTMNLANFGDATEVSLQGISISNRSILRLYERTLATGDSGYKANVSARNLTVGAGGGTLASNLTMDSTSELVLDGTLTLDGSLTLNRTLLSGALLGSLRGEGDEVTLVSGLAYSSLHIGSGVSTLAATDEVGQWMTDADGSSYYQFSSAELEKAFRELDSGAYEMRYYGTANGTSGSLALAYVPEPTSATLSLLALAGLCARRRRR